MHLQEIVFATHNNNKLKEIQQMMPEHIQLRSLTDIGCYDEIIENASTIEGNAKIKADFVFNNYGLPCFADDTGLLVDELNGAPGVMTARYAGETKSAAANMDKLLTELANKENRKAHFKTVIHFRNASTSQAFTGICKGEILTAKKGEKGFGYDPIFQPENYTLSFAEMDATTKNKISHRALAFKEFLKFLSF